MIGNYDLFYNGLMYFFLFILFLNVSSAHGKDICFPSTEQAWRMATRWDHEAQMLVRKLTNVGRKVLPTSIKVSKRCDNCLEIVGDEYVKGVFEEKFVELEKDLPKAGGESVPGVRVDVSIGKLIPIYKTNGHKTFDPNYIPFLRFPDKTTNTFYDKEKVPVIVSAKIVHLEIIEYTFQYKDKTHSVLNMIGDYVGCMFPYDNKNEKDVEFFKNLFEEEKFILEEGKYLPIDQFKLRSFYRDFTYKGEDLLSPHFP